MAAFLGFLLFMGAGVMVLAVVGAILRAMVAVLRAVGVLCVAGALGATIYVSASLYKVEREHAGAAGLMVAVLAAAVIFKRGGSKRMPDQVAGEEVLADPVVPEPEPYAGVIEPRAERKVSKAWEQLTGMLPAADVPSLHSARSACARLLAASDAEPLALELMETAVLIRRNVPELARRNASLWSVAGEAERADLSAGILTDVTSLEKWAAARLSVLHDSRRDDLHAIRNHLASRIEGRI